LSLTSSEALDLDTLSSTFTGPIHSPDAPGYDAARAPWNLAVDQRPLLVAQARSADDVAAVVRFAARRGLRVAVQGAGHGAARVGPLEHSVLLRTDLLRDVLVDPERRTARVEAGALWSDLLGATSPAGLAALGGSAPDIGVVAFALGGGIGWLSRAYGLCCHSVTAVELVTPAMGSIRCDDTRHPELFWALRGGGGDLGVVTAIELSLVPTPELYGGSMLWPWERAAEVLHAWRRWTTTVPETVTTAARLLQVPAFPDIPAPMRGRKFVTVGGALLAAPQTAESLLEPLRALDPEIDLFGSIPADALVRLHLEPEQPIAAHSRHGLLDRLSPDVVDAIVAAAGPSSGSTLLSVEVRHLGGALLREQSGALSHLDGGYLLFAVGMPTGSAERAIVDEDLNRVRAAAAPSAIGAEYLNFGDEPGQAARSFPPTTLEALARCRALTDPAGVMHTS
jgi:FAD binding domain